MLKEFGKIVNLLLLKGYLDVMDYFVIIQVCKTLRAFHHPLYCKLFVNGFANEQSDIVLLCQGYWLMKKGRFDPYFWSHINTDNLRLLQHEFRVPNDQPAEKVVLEMLGQAPMPMWIGGCRTQTRFQCFRSKMTFVQPSIGLMQQLELFEMPNHLITKLPDTIVMCENLHTMNLYNNLLESVPENIGLLFNLRDLYLHKNNIIRMPQSFSQLKRLREVRLDDNPLESLPPGIEEIQSLHSVYLPKKLKTFKLLMRHQAVVTYCGSI